MKNWAVNRKEILVFILYAGFTFCLLFFHENWRDEAQAWLLAKNCTIPELVDAMKHEGHFLLWYLMLMPFAKTGFPYGTTNVISWLITCLAVWLVLRKAPFGFDKKVLLVLTFPFLYLFPVISRCYCLIPLSIAVMSIYYKDRLEKPYRYLLSLVFLLNTHVIMTGMVGVVFLDYIIELCRKWEKIPTQEKQKAITGILIAVVLMLISIYPLMGCLDTNKEINRQLSLNVTEILFYNPIELLKLIFMGFSSNKIVFDIILLLTAITVILEVRNAPFSCFKMWLCITWQCFVNSSIVGPTPQRANLVFFIFLFFKWTDTENHLCLNVNLNEIMKKIKKLSWVCLMVLNITAGLVFISYEIQSDFSKAYEMANYINENLGDNSIVLSGSHVEFVSSIIPYIKKDIKFYHVPGKRYFSYSIWDDINKTDVDLETIRVIPVTFRNGENIYYIFPSEKSFLHNCTEEINLIKSLTEKKVLKELYYTNGSTVSSESYIIYKVDLGRI